MRIVLLVNDNPYNAQAFRKLCLSRHSEIVAIVFSTRILAGKNFSFLQALRWLLDLSGPQLFLFRAIEVYAYKWRRLWKHFGFYRNRFDMIEFAKANGIPIVYSTNVNAPDFLARFRAFEPDLAVSRINQILKKKIIEIPKMGMINSHSSLLPKYKGIDGVFWGMVNGDREFGTTSHFIVEKLDSGGVIAQEAVHLDSLTSGISLHGLEDVLNELSAEMLNSVVSVFSRGEKPASVPMSEVGASYFSFATREGYRRFKSRGHRLIGIHELLKLFL